MTSDEYEWLTETAAKLKAGEKLSAEEFEKSRISRLALQCGFKDTQVASLLDDLGGSEKLIVELSERVLMSARKLSKALADLYVSQDAAQRLKALEVVREIASSDPVELHREEARKILAAAEAGLL